MFKNPLNRTAFMSVGHGRAHHPHPAWPGSVRRVRALCGECGKAQLFITLDLGGINIYTTKLLISYPL